MFSIFRKYFPRFQLFVLLFFDEDKIKHFAQRFGKRFARILHPAVRCSVRTSPGRLYFLRLISQYQRTYKPANGYNRYKKDKLEVSYTHLRAHETDSYLVCRLLLEKKKTQS